MMIIITGANGQLGRMVVERLLLRVPAEQIGVSVREPEKAQALQERGVRMRHGDYTEPASLAHAFEGASQVLIVSSNSSGEMAVLHHRTAIDVAKQAGARRILYTSHAGSSPTSFFPPMVDHAATEVARLDEVNAFADASPGFLWRLQTAEGNATEVRAYEDELILFNMSVWSSLEDLSRFVYASESNHREVLKQRRQWFQRFDGPYMALWWIPQGHIPTVEEAKERLEHLRMSGETSYAFSFKRSFPPPNLDDANYMGTMVPHTFVERCKV